MASDTGKIVNIFVRLFCVFVAVNCASPDTLKLVNVVYRHGDRSPLTFFPTDPHKDKWPQGPGWLTTVGMRQQYALGQFLRSEYGNLLSPTYKNTEIVVASSNVNRSLMSAYCNLAGLYPPQGDQVWNPNLLWQPIPVHTRPVDEDHVLAIEEKCPRYSRVYHEELRSPLVLEEEAANSEFYDYLEKHTGVRPENITNAWEVADTLFCEKTHNYSLPEWAEAKWDNVTVYDKLRGISKFSFNLLFNKTELSRLKGGPLLGAFLNNMLKASREEQHYKMYMYSAHDSTVAAVSDALKVFNCMPPPYAAALLVELHQSGPDYCVRVRYKNETDAPPYTLINPDCKQECCPLDELVAVTKSQIPQDWEKECGNELPIITHKVVIGALIAVCCLLALILLIGCGVAYRYGLRSKEYTPLP